LATPTGAVVDAVVAVDAGVDHLLRHGGVTPEAVRDLVYGALFTRGPWDIHRTAVFVGVLVAALLTVVAGVLMPRVDAQVQPEPASA